MSSRRRRALTVLAFLAPNLTGFVVFTAAPVVFSLFMAFTNWNIVQAIPTQFVGLENFRVMLSRDEFWLYLINTFYLMLGIPVSIAGSLFFAMLLTRNIRGIAIYRTIFYLPSFTAGVALFILWKRMFSPDSGPINQLVELIPRGLGWASFEGPAWLASTSNLLGLLPNALGMAWGQFGLGARDAIVVMGVWLAIGGNNMLLYIAGLSSIPQELYEAAEIDGAGRWATFRHVTWPQLAPTTFFITIMSVIGGLQGGFEQARVMTAGGPAGTTTTLAYYIYDKAFTEFQLGYASSVAWFLFVIIFALTLVNWQFGSRHVTY